MIKSSFSVMLLTGSLVLTGLSSCKKNDDDSSKSKTQLISSGKWKVTATGIDSDNNNTIDVPYQLEDCDKDNTIEFKSDGTGIADEGADKCDPEDPQTDNFTWAFINNETQISLSLTDDLFDGDATIITLTDKNLDIYIEVDNPIMPGSKVRVISKLVR